MADVFGAPADAGGGGTRDGLRLSWGWQSQLLVTRARRAGSGRVAGARRRRWWCGGASGAGVVGRCGGAGWGLRPVAMVAGARRRARYPVAANRSSVGAVERKFGRMRRRLPLLRPPMSRCGLPMWRMRLSRWGIGGGGALVPWQAVPGLLGLLDSTVQRAR